MAVLLILGGRLRKISVMWAHFCLSVSIWGLGGLQATITSDPEKSFFWWQIANISSLFTPVIFYHFILVYCHFRENWFLKFNYLLATIYLVINFFARDFYIGQLSYMFDKFYYIDWTRLKNPAYLLFYVYFYWILLSYSFGRLLQYFVSTRGVVRNQLKYFIIGMMIGFLGAHLLFLPAFGVSVYPYSNILIAIYPIIIGYSIVRYRLMDITLAITRTSIFVVVYSIVLGGPLFFAFGFRESLVKLLGDDWWIVPLISSTIFATVGPFIYLFMQRKAEERLLREQHQYQSTLRQASLGMGQIKDLKRLLRLIVHIVSKSVRLEHCEIYLFHQDSDQFVLKAVKTQGFRMDENYTIPGASPLVEHLKEIKEPLVYEELKQRYHDTDDLALADVVGILKKLDAAIVVPSFIEQRLLAIIVLGKKRGDRNYSQDDLVVFSILANQAALAIENAQFYEDMKRTHQQLFKAEKMATIGTMADGLSHQINNRLHAMGFIAGDALDTIKHSGEMEMPKAVKSVLEELRNALERIEENVRRGGEIVEGLLKYSRKGEEGLTSVDLTTLVNASLEMAKFKVKLSDITVVRKYNTLTPKIKGNFTQLQEVFFNLIDNAYDAMMQRKNDIKEPGYLPTLEISAVPVNNKLEVVIQDNGIGVKKEDIQKLFTPFFTTKLSSKKGTGLGLYVIRQIIEENHQGTVSFSSEYMGGTRMKMVLPMASETTATNLN